MEMNVFDCAVFAAGTRVSKAVVKKYISKNTFLIAADAGYKACDSYGITPNLLVGDYDSAEMPQTDIELIKLNPVKDETDSAYALELAIARGYKNIIMFGATGGRLDHTFANLELCASLKQRGIALTLIDDHHTVFAVRNERITLKAQNKYISIFPFGGPCTLTLVDFDYPLDHRTLQAFCGLGVSNEMHKETAEIIAEAGMALVIIADKD